jgi:hypothetical protein
VNRRDFLAKGLTIVIASSLPSSRLFGALRPAYRLAPENLLPDYIRKAPEKVREAYRFAIANREVLRYIPCYCGCGADGHTSNASCYVKDSSTPTNLVFDRMSLN